MDYGEAGAAVKTTKFTVAGGMKILSTLGRDSRFRRLFPAPPARLGACGVLCLSLLMLAPRAVAQQESAQRLSIFIGQSRVVQLADVGTVMVIDNQVAEAAPSEGGFTIIGHSSGDTIVQVFTASGLHVYVVAVQPPPPGPPGPPPPPNMMQTGAIKSFWADNRYQLHLSQSSTMGWYLDHTLSFHGRAGKGEYRAMAEFTNGDLGNEFQRGTVGWLSDKRDLGFEVGDTTGKLFGNTLAGGVALRGLRANRSYALANERGTWGYEVFTGEMLGSADVRGTSLSQPVVGGSVETSLSPRNLRDLRISLGSSVLAYSSARLSEQTPGLTGIIVGAVARAVRRNGFGLELRSGLSSSTAHATGARTESAASFGALALYQNEKGGQRIEYELDQRDFVSPQTGQRNPGYQRVSASFSRTIHGITGTGSGSYSEMEDLAGHALGALSYRFGATIPIHRQTNFTLSAGETSTAMPRIFAGTGLTFTEWTQSSVGARLDHTTRNGRLGFQSEVNYFTSESSDGDATGTNAMVSVQRRRPDNSRWDAAGAVSVNLSQTHAHLDPSVPSAIAADQAPINFGVALGSQARFVQGPFESFGGLNLQTTEMPTFQVAPSVNLGVRFTPTAAHQIVATFNVTRAPGGGQTSYGTTVNYTYRFGDSIRAVPIFEFMSYGVVEGHICFDENSDGVCSPDEPPLPHVPILLSDGSHASSDANGYYRFERVKPGFYHLEVDEAAMRERGRPTTMLLASFDLPVRGDESHSFGVARACRIQGHVIHDVNLDGKGDPNEPLFGGPLVVATGAGGSFPLRVNNIGTFAGMVPCGEYDLEIDGSSLPELYSVGKIGTVHVVASATKIPSAMLTVTSIRTISGVVFLDRNGNGKKDVDEPAVAGALVRFGKVVGRSDETGSFLLRHLPAGRSELAVDPASLKPDTKAGAPRAIQLGAQPAALEDVNVPLSPAR